MTKAEQRDVLAREVLALSRNTLLVSLRFLDAALSQFKWVSVQEQTLMTDGECIYYTPEHILRCYKEHKEIPVRHYLHIVMHCVFRHMYMDPTLNHLYWDLACDIAVENVITELGLKSATTPAEREQARYIETLKRVLKNVTAEKVYSFLRQTMPDPKKITEIRRLFYADNHVLWYMSDEQIAVYFGLPKRSVSKSVHRQEMVVVWQAISQRMQVELEMFSKQQGIRSGSMTQNLAAVNREKYDYTAFLKKFAVMGEQMRINDDEFDYIFYTYGLQLYKKVPLIEPLEYKDVWSIKEFVIAIDTSGSTSGALVQRFVQKTYNILKSTESFFTKINIHIIQCDAKIKEDKKITCQKDFDEYLKTMQIRGLGGTDFRPVFEYVQTLQQNEEFQNLKGLIYFTDGYGVFPAKKPNYDTAFVFVDDEDNNLDVPPWAIKLILPKETI